MSLTTRSLQRSGARAPDHSYDPAKRAFDLVLCSLALPFALCLIAVLAILIRLDSRGPAIFRQERVGRDGRHFRIYKFRTLVDDGEDDEDQRAFMRAVIRGEVGIHGRSSFKPPDQRKTRLGAFLRRSSLDELPQILNVLRGEMSLVGPRPHVAFEVEAYKEWHARRLSVLPGITGLAQVRGRSRISFDELVYYDLEYIESRSLALDLRILWWTASAVLGARGAE